MAGITATGLTAAEAARRLAADGPNALPAPPRAHPLRLLVGQLVHFFAIMLWVAAALALLGGLPELAAAIAAVVVLNGVFSFVQEYRADRATVRLRDLLPVRATVRRDGRATVVDALSLVVGDVVLLEAGDRVCADLTVLGGSRLAVDEGMLTGESDPVRPRPGQRLSAGTYVVQGQATTEVVATGARTAIAAIAAVTAGATRPQSPLTTQLHRVVRLMALSAVGVGCGFFAAATLLGLGTTDSFLFAVGVTVALVPEGLLPTVTLSLARTARLMAGRHALVRRLESVQTLGATTFICTDKTGTLTRNEMAVVTVWTPAGEVQVDGTGYDPHGQLTGSPDAVLAAQAVAVSAARCSPDAATVRRGANWHPVGDPMEVALHVLAARAGGGPAPAVTARHAFDPDRRRASVVDADGLHVTGAPDAVLPRCARVPADATAAVERLSHAGLRVLAVAHRVTFGVDREPEDPDEAERDLVLLGLAALQDPPRPDVGEAVAACRQAGIRLAMVTGDHPGTAAAIAREVGLSGPHQLVVEGRDLPVDDTALGELLDRDGVVVARVTPQDKLRIAQALQARGHVVAMTGDGVNDGPALRAADIGVAMGASGTDVAREAADLVLLDDHFGTVVGAIELGRATHANIRRFLTYHLTDNVAELTPFVVWALSGGSIPLAITVLQVLALDIGTDLLPALALGAEPPNPRTMRGRGHTSQLIDAGLLRRAFGVLGPAEAATAMVGFVVVLLAGGWSFGAVPEAELLAQASGTAFAAIVLGQLANAFACRSRSSWVGRVPWNSNPLLLYAVGFEVIMLAVFLGLPPLPDVLGATLPGPLGWAMAALAVPAVLLADTAQKAAAARRGRVDSVVRAGRR